MSTKEMAYSILEQLTEEQLIGFVLLFVKYYPEIISSEEYKKLAEKAVDKK